MKVYHYTDQDGQRSIMRDESISVSTGAKSRDAFHGQGVYLTSMDPESHTKEELAENNWQVINQAPYNYK